MIISNFNWATDAGNVGVDDLECLDYILSSLCYSMIHSARLMNESAEIMRSWNGVTIAKTSSWKTCLIEEYGCVTCVSKMRKPETVTFVPRQIIGSKHHKVM